VLGRARGPPRGPGRLGSAGPRRAVGSPARPGCGGCWWPRSARRRAGGCWPGCPRRSWGSGCRRRRAVWLNCSVGEVDVVLRSSTGQSGAGQDHVHRVDREACAEWMVGRVPEPPGPPFAPFVAPSADPSDTHLSRRIVLLDLRRIHVVAVTLTVRNVFHVPPPILMIPTSIHLLHEARRPRVMRPPAAPLTPLGAVTMSIHKLTAGSGYDYLTRQVAALDATAKGHIGLASYYAERGESPGVWVGAGLAGIDGLDAGDAVTGEQMRLCSARGCIRWRRSGWNSSATLISLEPTSGRQPGWGCRSRSPTPNRAGFGLRWRNGSPRSTRRRGCRRTGQSRLPSGPGYGPRWRGSCSPQSMAGHQ
jgi:hypothetical protein